LTIDIKAEQTHAHTHTHTHIHIETDTHTCIHFACKILTAALAGTYNQRLPLHLPF